MRLLLAILLLIFSSVAYADGVLRGTGDNMIVFKEAPCTHPAVLALIKPEFQKAFKQAAVKIDGRFLAACWGVSPDEPDTVYLMDAEGDGIAVPRKAITFDVEV